uniref:hypothetical protein n=1 Tax=Methanosarcina mazei TaxID=2209 RepID=UPI000ABF4230
EISLGLVGSEMCIRDRYYSGAQESAVNYTLNSYKQKIIIQSQKILSLLFIGHSFVQYLQTMQ